jgi:uncharacterized protein (DUF1015 family)
VSAPPYDVLSYEDCLEIKRKNPNSFVRVSRAEIDLPPKTDIYSEQVYEKALENFIEIGKKIPYLKEAEPNYYIYKLKMGSHVQFGICALASVDDYRGNKIKKHEKTRQDKEDDRTRHILKVRSHSGPVLLMYKDEPNIDKIVEKTVKNAKPFIDFTAENGVAHSLWRLKSAEMGKLFADVDCFYIADGHHRAASAARVAEILDKKNADKTDNKRDYTYFLAVAFPSSQMKILPYNRLLKDFNGKDKKSLLDFIKSKFGAISEGKKLPSANGDIALFVGNKWFSFSLNKLKKNSNSPEKNLDAAILQDELLETFFGISDPRTDKRIDFAGGIKGAEYLEKEVLSGRAVAALAMFPVSAAEIMDISDSGGIMPPKSTWFEPKLRDGLLLDKF